MMTLLLVVNLLTLACVVALFVRVTRAKPDVVTRTLATSSPRPCSPGRAVLRERLARHEAIGTMKGPR